MDTGAKHRLLLSLRSEQAMGLSSIRRPQREPVAAMILEEEIQAVSLAPLSLPLATPFEAVQLSTEQKQSRLQAMREKEVVPCTKCRLSQGRTQTVFGEGDVDAKIMFVGEGPGENEDLTGRPFVGRAGQLLDKMIVAMGLRREQVYIANIVKCRPPQNRVPAPDEVATCTPYLERQIEIIRPAVIVTLGRPAASYMLGNPKLTMGSVRGRWHEWRQIKLMPTFHPSYVLRTYTEAVRKAVWDDLKKVMEEVGK
jgi:DNA polymerase